MKHVIRLGYFLRFPRLCRGHKAPFLLAVTQALCLAFKTDHKFSYPGRDRNDRVKQIGYSKTPNIAGSLVISNTKTGDTQSSGDNRQQKFKGAVDMCGPCEELIYLFSSHRKCNVTRVCRIPANVIL